MSMGLLDNFLRRFGYVKIANYGLTLAPNGHLMPITAMAPPQPPPTVWQAQTGGGLPLPAPEVTREAWTNQPPQQFPPPVPVAQTQPQPYPQSVTQAPTQAQAPAAPPEKTDPEGDWEWKLAMARAKAREDETQVIPQASQATQIVQNPLNAPRPTSPPPHPPQRQRMARATTPPTVAQAPSHRPQSRRPSGVRSKFYPSRLPGVEARPSDRPLARPALGDDTAVDTKRAPAASGGPLPRFTDRFANAG